MATPVIINTSSIKNYSQTVTSPYAIKSIKSIEELKEITSGLEIITLWNAVIIPLKILKVILLSHTQAPEQLTINILREMLTLDSKPSPIFTTKDSMNDPEEIIPPKVSIHQDKKY